MYGKVDPAFETARFYAIAQPLSIALLMATASMALPRSKNTVRAAIAAVLLLLLSGWIVQNRQKQFSLVQGPDGLLRTTDVDAMHRALRAENPAAVFNGIGVFAYTGFDAVRIYPSNIRGIWAPKKSKVAILHWIEPLNPLLSAIGKEGVPPIRALREGEMEVTFFELPQGFHIDLTP
jgi:hypothetical protein